MFNFNKLKVVKVRYYSILRIFLYYLFHSDINVIINDKTPPTISHGYQKGIDIEYALSIFGPILYGDQHVMTIIYREHQFSSYKHIIQYSVITNNKIEYHLSYCIYKHKPEDNYYYLSYIDHQEDKQQTIFDGNYINFSSLQLGTQQVLCENWILGFEPAQKIKIPEPLCMTCVYFCGSDYIRCAVNPDTRTRNCFDCRDYELNPDKKFNTDDYY
jgi:hypothetical protein